MKYILVSLKTIVLFAFVACGGSSLSETSSNTVEDITQVSTTELASNTANNEDSSSNGNNISNIGLNSTESIFLESSTSTTTTINIRNNLLNLNPKGTVIDAEIAGATVFLDLNRDGNLSSDEPFTISKADGSFELILTTVQKEHKNYLNKQAPIIAYGGIDIRSNKPFEDYLKSTFMQNGTVNVTPFSTLISEVIDEALDGNTTKTMEEMIKEAKLDIVELYGIDEEIIDANPIELAKNGDYSLLNQSLQLHKTTQVIKMALVLSQGSDRESAKAVLSSYRDLAKSFKTLKNKTSEDNRTIIAQVLEEVMNEQGNTFDAKIKETIKRSVEQMTKEIDDFFKEYEGSTVDDTTLNSMVELMEENIPLTMVLFSEKFSYADGTELDIEYENNWTGRYDDSVDATIQNGRAILSSWATLGLKEQFKNLRDQWTRVSVDLFNESQISYMMSDAYGITVKFDGNDRLTIASGNTAFAPQCAYESIGVVPDVNNSIKVEIYVKDNKAIVHAIDTKGRQSTKLLDFTYGDIDYTLGLGYHGAYDNLEIAYLKDEPPVVKSKNRTPLFITERIEESVIAEVYKSQTIDETMRDIVFVPVQIYADQGEGVVQYKVIKGLLPIGVSLSSEYNMTGNQNSPDRYLARLHGVPRVVGDYYFTIEATDELEQKSSRDFYIKVKDINAQTIFYYDDFNETNGENATTRKNSIWEAKSELPILDTKADVTQNSLKLNTLLRNDPRQYLHIRTKFYPQKSTSTASTAIWLTGGGAFGISAKYEDGKVTVLGDNIGYAPQTNRDEFNVTLAYDKPLIMDVYLKGNQSRVYIIDANSTQATILYSNYRLPDEESDYQLYVDGEDTLVDEVLIETTSSLPEFYNELKITTADVREGFRGLSYFDTLTVMSGKAPYSWTATSLPDGLSLSSEGIITGVASSSGISLVTFTVTDALANSDSVDINLSIKADDTQSGVLLFADDFDISPSEVTVSVRDGEHYAAHPDYALRYEGNKLLIQPHKQGSLKKSFFNDGTETLQFSWSMNKGKVNILREGTCYGVSIEYDSVQKVKISWGDICYDPYMEQRDFILKSSQEEIHVAIEIKGQELVFEVKDSNETYQRGKFTITSRDITNQNMFVGFRDNTPYGVGLYTSYQSGNMYVDNLRIVQGADSLMNPASKLKEKEDLGKLLFYDPILSNENNRACVSCHLPQKAFTDGKQGSMGLDGIVLTRNTPGLTSAALMGSFFHDGRASSITEQSLATIINSKEMNQDLDALVIELSNINDYENKFNNIWIDGITATHVGNALEAYINTLLEMRTKFDQDLYRQGDFMNETQTAGLILFNGKAQCTLCHILEPINNIGDFVYNKPKFEVTGTPSINDLNQLTSDIGRMAVTGEEKDRAAFRVPPLRDLLRTAPYMHNGVFSTLEEVVEFYNDGGGKGRGLIVPNQSEFMFPLELSVTEKSELVEFLKAMSPEYPANFSIPKTVPSGLPVGGRFGDDEDNDEDGIVNKIDNCPMHQNVDQVDSDSDGFGDVCDG